MRLWKKLKNKPFCSEVHFFFFALVLVLIALKYPFFWVPLSVYAFFIGTKTKLFFPILLLIVFFLIRYHHASSVKLPKEETMEGVFQVVEEKRNYYVLKGDFLFLVYKTDDSLKLGDVLKATVSITLFEEKSYEADFDAKAYYLSEHIVAKGILHTYELLGQSNPLLILKKNVFSYYQQKLEQTASEYVLSFLFAQPKMDDSIQDAYRQLNIIHLLAISGFHFYFLYRLLLRFFRSIFKIEGQKVSLMLLFFYLVIIGFPVSACRAYLFLLLSFWNRRQKVQYSSLDLYSFTFIIIAFANPLCCYQNSFILSFTVSFILLFRQEFAAFGHLKNQCVLSFLAYFSIFPFVIQQSNELNWVGVLLSPLLSWIASVFLFPYLIVLLVVPMVSFYPFLSYWNDALLFLANLGKKIIFPSFSWWQTVLYYAVYAFVFYCWCNRCHRKKAVGFLLLFLSVFFIRTTTNQTFEITFIDVGQGDSALIRLKGGGVVLIDSYYGNIDYLKKEGIQTIDYLILTHFDRDHMDTAQEVIERFSVRHFIYSAYEPLEEIPFAHQVVCLPFQGGMQFECNKYPFYCLGPQEEGTSSNANSLVFQVTLENQTFLFTGDIEEKQEKGLLNTYGSALASDVLKVAHHGSMTSSSETFLACVRPKISVVSVGKNQYGFPSAVILERLKRYGTVYTTKENGNITFLFQNNRWQVQVYR